MKFCSFAIALFLSVNAFIVKAQDSLSLKSSENIPDKVVVIESSELKQIGTDEMNDPGVSLPESDVLNLKNDLSENSKTVNSFDMYTQGQIDAQLYYRGYKPAGTAVLFTTALPWVGIFLGVVPALITSSTMPLDINLGCPDLQLMKNEQYLKGYKQKAKQIKRKKVLNNYLYGLAIQPLYAVLGFGALIASTL
jgi:hypothetical protein